MARLKKLPPRPTIRPSTLNASHPDPSHKKRRRGKRPGSAKRQKTRELIIHETIPLAIDGLPEGTRQNGYEDFVVQELKIESHNICYRRLRYVLPDGTSRTAPLPAHVQGHFGPGLRSHVLYQHHQNHVTQPLIHEESVGCGHRHLDRSDRPPVDRRARGVPRGEGCAAACGTGGVELFPGRRHGLDTRARTPTPR